MMMTKEMKDRIIEMYFTGKKVSRCKANEEMLNKFLSTIDALNNLHWCANQFMGEQISDIRIPQMFKDLILPRTVTLDNDPQRQVDLLVRPVAPEAKDVMTHYEWTEACIAICSAYRTDMSSAGADVTSFRVDKALSSVVKLAVTEDGYVQQSEVPFIPVQLTVQDFWREDEYSVKAESMILKWCMATFTSKKTD